MLKWLKNIFQKPTTEKIQLRFKLKDGTYIEEMIDPYIFEQRLNQLQFENYPVVNENPDFIWCLVGNVVDENYAGENKELKHGTKHFSPNTKVYCFPVQWGDGYDNIKVIGKHRKSSKKITLIMPSKQITNWRLRKVFDPFVIRIMRSQNGWSGLEEDKTIISEMLESLTNSSKSIKTNQKPTNIRLIKNKIYYNNSLPIASQDFFKRQAFAVSFDPDEWNIETLFDNPTFTFSENTYCAFLHRQIYSIWEGLPFTTGGLSEFDSYEETTLLTEGLFQATERLKKYITEIDLDQKEDILWMYTDTEEYRIILDNIELKESLEKLGDFLTQSSKEGKSVEFWL